MKADDIYPEVEHFVRPVDNHVQMADDPHRTRARTSSSAAR